MSINESRVVWCQAKVIADFVVGRIKESDPDIRLEICGSIARKRPDCGDVDLATTESDLPKIVAILEESMTHYPICDKLEYTKGTKKNPSKLHHGFAQGMKIEFYVGKDNAFGAICLFANGSGMFNVLQRRVALSKGYKLSQYGLFKDEEFVAGETEES